MCMLFIFLFCKQKRAYEMRISDWSSDVCSSDLSKTKRRAKRPSSTCVVPHLSLVKVEGDPPTGRSKLREKRVDASSSSPKRHGFIRKDRIEPTQIGRASCRERVCRYV